MADDKKPMYGNTTKTTAGATGKSGTKGLGSGATVQNVGGSAQLGGKSGKK